MSARLAAKAGLEGFQRVFRSLCLCVIETLVHVKPFTEGSHCSSMFLSSNKYEPLAELA